MADCLKTAPAAREANMKINRILGAAAGVVLGLTAAAFAQEPLKVGSYPANPPWEAKTEAGTFEGFEVDIVNEIAKRMGVTAQYAGEYRRRLIRDGIIEPAGHGKVRFTIPYTADHLREHAAHDALEGLADENP